MSPTAAQLGMTEYATVEQPFIDQLKAMGWQYVGGDIDVPELTERESFRDVLLLDRLRSAIRSINLDEDGNEWLDDARVEQAVLALQRLKANKLIEANQAATDLLVRGTQVDGDPDRHGGRDQTVRFFDFDNPENNDFLVINQFRVDPPWATANRDFIIPDLVLFVNGIPLVVVECKSPGATNPIEEAITQLMRYANQRDWVEENEGAERLFHYNQFTVATKWDEARAGTITASYEHYYEWKDTSPVPTAEVAAALGVEKLSSQQTLVAGMLRPAHLLDIVRHFTLFEQISGKMIKLVSRYQQFRAVHKSIERLRTGKTRPEDGEHDRRGGIVWHTQGSGKSISMVFLVRKIRSTPDLRRLKVVFVTDRKNLEKQLRDTATLTNETVRRATSTMGLWRLLREKGSDLVFGMIQKYQHRDDEPGERLDRAGESTPFPLNESTDILVLVDEAHRSQASELHANLMLALPNCAKIAFTGTPIIMGHRKRTHEIFGEFIDRYTIKQSERDGVTVPILYEGREIKGDVAEAESLNELFDRYFASKTEEEREEIKKRFATKSRVFEAPSLIEAKAKDMLRHYVDNILPSGFKAQLVAVSRLAAIRYQGALVKARDELVAEIELVDPALLMLTDEKLADEDHDTQVLVRAHRHLDLIKGLEFAAVISGDHNDDSSFREWSDRSKVDERIERFKRPLTHKDPAKQDRLAFLCVKSMLLTGFDAPIEQAMYLDRFMQGHELLQAIARVNRTASGKSNGIVVDYFGVGARLKEALAVYSAEDVEGALVSIKDELPILADRHARVLATFQDRGIPDITDTEACVGLLRDMEIRAEFIVRLKQFLDSLDKVMPRPEAVPFLRDAKLLGYINKVASNRYRDSQLNIVGAGPMVRDLIDRHIISAGIDPKIPPIAITADEFEAAVDDLPSPRAKAAEMEHAARYYISRHVNEDPAYYRSLSERLEAILQECEGNWDGLVAALRDFVGGLREGRPQDESGLDPRTQAPFLGILIEDSGLDSKDKSSWEHLIEPVVDMVEHISQEVAIRDFWRSQHKQEVLRKWIIQFLDDRDLIEFRDQERVADRLVQLAKHRHVDLTK